MLSKVQESGRVAHICNSRYSGERNQEDHISKPDRQKVKKTPMSPSQHRSWAQYVPII
jgi:hypothetical protein